jgi:hypothetical protein
MNSSSSRAAGNAMSTTIRRAASIFSAVALSLFLAGCFISQDLFPGERLWDPAWLGRYESDGVMFVVLPQDPAARTYLVGSFEGGKSSVDVYSVALYPGWGNTTIVGSRILGKDNGQVVYTLLRALGHERFTSDWPDCSADFAARHAIARTEEMCSFTALSSLRAALKSYADEKARNDAKAGVEPKAEPKAIEHRHDHPLSTIGVSATASVVSDSEGAHGTLRLESAPAGSPAANAGLKAGDLIFSVGNTSPATGEELLLRIAAAAPGTSLQIAYFDGVTHAKREATVVTAARPDGT